jgi:hypothetical protein
MLSNHAAPIDSSNIEAVRRYIRQQFEQRSWWPTEGPLQAQADFTALQGSPAGLTEWCSRWLSAAQRRALDKAVRVANGILPP